MNEKIEKEILSNYDKVQDKLNKLNFTDGEKLSFSIVHLSAFLQNNLKEYDNIIDLIKHYMRTYEFIEHDLDNGGNSKEE